METPFHTAEEFLGYLDSLNFFHMDMALTRMEKALSALGLRRPPYLVIQVVGTNGKGSTSTFLASLLEHAGIRTGLYTSPHFVHPMERIRIDGRCAWEELWLPAAQAAIEASDGLTYFELMTVTALEAFRRAGVGAVVLEAGLGARYDATSATAADIVCLVPMALDHTAILGPTVSAIAEDKSCAIRSQAPVVTATQSEEAMTVIRDRARTFHAPLIQASPVGSDVSLGLAGSHQRENAGNACEAFRLACEALGITPRPEHVATALASAFIPGRLQHVSAAEADDSSPIRPTSILDGAHNLHGMTSLVSYLRESGASPRAVVYSCLRDKDWKPGLRLLADTLPNVPFLVPSLHNDRAEEAKSIACELLDRECRTYDTLSASMQAATAIPGDGPVLVTGSLYLLADYFALYPAALGPYRTDA